GAARRGLVQIIASAGGPLNATTTDLDGRYEFTELPAGEYRISAGKPGYLAVEYGQRRPFEHGTVVTIRDGETLEKLDLTLPASGAISGRVLDENGDPVEGVDVQLMQVQFGANRRQLLPVIGVGRRSSNDQGRYRLFGVAPGQYIVMASVNEQRNAPNPAVLPSGYAPTYYPGLPSASGARPIAVGLGQEIEDIDFALARAGTARISGTIVDATGKPLATGITASTSQRSGGLSGEPLRAMSRADGTFEIPNVPPGEWVLQAISGAN